MWRVFAWVLGWVGREIVIKFFVFTALFLLVGLLVPYAVKFLGSFVNPGALTQAFSGIPPGVWYFLDFFMMGYGLPLCLSAVIGRFLIRRLPVIG